MQRTMSRPLAKLHIAAGLVRLYIIEMEVEGMNQDSLFDAPVQID